VSAFGDDRGEPVRALQAVRLVKWLALAAILAMLVGRVIAPSAAGVTVGIGGWVEGLDYAAGLTAQLLALFSAMVALWLMVTAVRQPISIVTRSAAIVLGGVAILISLSAAGTRSHEVTLYAIGSCSGVLAIMVAWDAVRAPASRLVGLAVGAAGISTIVRLTGVALAAHAVELHEPGASAWARGMATIAVSFDLSIVLGAVFWIATRDRRVAAPVLVVTLIVSLLLTRTAALPPDDPGAWAILIARGAHRLLLRPEPYLPLAVDLFIAISSVGLALSALAVRTRVPAFAGAMSIALLVRSSGEVPLFGILLVVAALAIMAGGGGQTGREEPARG
jgi:hypothetical protein